MNGILQILIKRSGKNTKDPKVQLLGSNPLFYKALSVDKKIYKIKRRKWD
jgi:hypothetical protein